MQGESFQCPDRLYLLWCAKDCGIDNIFCEYGNRVINKLFLWLFYVFSEKLRNDGQPGKWGCVVLNCLLMGLIKKKQTNGFKVVCSPSQCVFVLVKFFGQGWKYGIAGKSVCKCSCITCQYRLISDAEGRTDAGLILLETQNVPQHSSPHAHSWQNRNRFQKG